MASEKSAKQSRQIAVIYQKDGYQHRKFEVEQWAKNREWQLQQDLATKSNLPHLWTVPCGLHLSNNRLIGKTFKKILSKISDYDHTRVFLNSRDRRHPDTGNWMFKLPEYQDWKASTSSEVLWCHGIRMLHPSQTLHSTPILIYMWNWLYMASSRLWQNIISKLGHWKYIWRLKFITGYNTIFLLWLSDTRVTCI